jgi:hypothetical protein
VLIPDDSMPKWPVVHEPTHDEMLKNISQFIKKIIHVIRVVPRIEHKLRRRLMRRRRLEAQELLAALAQAAQARDALAT